MKLSHILVVGLTTSLIAGMLFHMSSHRAMQHRTCAADRAVEHAVDHAIDHAVEHAIQHARMRDHRSGSSRSAVVGCAQRRERQARNKPVPRPYTRNSTITQDTMLVDIQRATVEQLIAEDRLMYQARLLPRLGKDDLPGVRVAAIRAGSVFELIGLRDGDVILTINEQPVRAASFGRDYLGPVRLPAHLDFAIERDGQSIRIVVLLHD